MSVRTLRERALQSLAFEVCALGVSIPFYLVWTGAEVREGSFVVLVLALAEALNAPVHNTLFDRWEQALCRRCASDRPARWRLVHAVSLELTGTLICVPVLMFLGGHGLWEAVALDLGLTAVFVTYTYVFHAVYDRLRPVGTEAAAVPRR